MVVSKASGNVEFCRAAWQQFAAHLPLPHRAVRWWNRRMSYQATGPEFCHLDPLVRAAAGELIASEINSTIGCAIDCSIPLLQGSDEASTDDASRWGLFVMTDGRYYEISRAEGACEHGWRVDGDQAVICPATCESLQRLWDFQLDLMGCY